MAEYSVRVGSRLQGLVLKMMISLSFMRVDILPALDSDGFIAKIVKNIP